MIPNNNPVVKEDNSQRNRLALLLCMGWLGTNLGLAATDLPLKFLLKEQLHLNAAGVSAFFAIAIFTNYVKPIAGILTDSVPLFGTRRRWYLLLSLIVTGIGFLVLPGVPRTVNALMLTYAILYAGVMFTSTTLGGTMVEIGMRYRNQGQLTAQRIGMFRLGSLIGGPIGGWLAAHAPFWAAMSVGSVLHLILVPLFYVSIKEPHTSKFRGEIWVDAGAQLKSLSRNRTLLSAAGMIILIAASPGFGTPLLFYQTDALHFKKEFIGLLGSISAATGLLGSMLYFKLCKRVRLRKILLWSIIIHALGTMFYLGYHDSTSAIWITALSGITGTLAILPVYDLASRGTPRGSEALGYSVMMSVWNLTNSLSDWSGSILSSKFHYQLSHLVWLNAGTTILTLLVVPLLPAILMNSRDGGAAAAATLDEI